MHNVVNKYCADAAKYSDDINGEGSFSGCSMRNGSYVHAHANQRSHSSGADLRSCNTEYVASYFLSGDRSWTPPLHDASHYSGGRGVSAYFSSADQRWGGDESSSHVQRYSYTSATVRASSRIKQDLNNVFNQGEKYGK